MKYFVYYGLFDSHTFEEFETLDEANDFVKENIKQQEESKYGNPEYIRYSIIEGIRIE